MNLETHGEHAHPLADRDWSHYHDPARRHSAEWADGYEITFQVSPSRQTAEIQFGDGSSRDKPQNYDAIKQLLTEEGLRWNGTNAQVINLHPAPRFRAESHAEKLDRQAANAQILARVEDYVLPAVIALDEEKRGRSKATSFASGSPRSTPGKDDEAGLFVSAHAPPGAERGLAEAPGFRIGLTSG